MQDTAEGELVTQPLSAEEIQEEIERMGRLLADFQMERLDAFFGWGCNDGADNLWRPTTVAPTEVVQFSRKGTESGVYPVGRGDLFIEHSATGTTVQFCHESDVHVRSGNAFFLAVVLSSWKARGWKVLRRTSGTWRDA